MNENIRNGNGATKPEVFGASQVGVFDFVPRVGYREYWYPGVEAKLIKRKPVALKILDEDIVFFRDKDGKVAALTDYCPHRGARFSGGFRRTGGGGPEPGRHNDEFSGYLTCPYHGFTFDGTGECVAALTEGPDSGLVSRLRAQAYPTVELKGIVFVWMGKTAPVDIKDDIPDYFFDDDVMVETYIRRWDLNWSLTIENSHDSHAVKIHRGSLRRVWTRGIFRKSAGFHGRMRIAKEGENYIHITASADSHAGTTAFYPRIGKSWPQKTWFMVKKSGRSTRQGARKQFDQNRPATPVSTSCRPGFRPTAPATDATCAWPSRLTATPVACGRSRSRARASGRARSSSSCGRWTTTCATCTCCPRARTSTRTCPFRASAASTRIVRRSWALRMQA